MAQKKLLAVGKWLRAVLVFGLLHVGGATAAYAESGTVIAVLDGDTVSVLQADNSQLRCRLAGIDAPEKSQAFGQASKKSLSDLIYKQMISVKVSDHDRYGRAICWITTTTGINVNLEQVSRGMAWVYRRYTTDATLLRAEAQARQAARGLWADAHPMAPWDYRHAGNK